MKFPRSAGVLLHPTSLPGQYGIGDLGHEAQQFISYLHQGGIKIWQVLPLNPTGYGDSPYQSLSVFAGNPLLISLEKLVQKGCWMPECLVRCPAFPKIELISAWSSHGNSIFSAGPRTNFFASANANDKSAFDDFVAQNQAWLDDYALFMAAKDAHQGRVWTEWDPELAARRPSALTAMERETLG